MCRALPGEKFDERSWSMLHDSGRLVHAPESSMTEKFEVEDI
jgi:hypothetical protein